MPEDDAVIEAMARAMASENGWRWGFSDGPTNMVEFAASGQPTNRSRNWWRNTARAALNAYRAEQVAL